MSYARLSRKPVLFKSLTGLEIADFDIISKEIESKYYEHEIKRFPIGKEKEMSVLMSLFDRDEVLCGRSVI